MSRIQLQNPVPLEAAIQLRRHLLRIRKSAGFKNDIVEAGIGQAGRSLENTGLSSIRTAFVSTIWDLDQCMDQSPSHTNGLHEYHSACWLNCYLYVDNKDPMGMDRARTELHADLIRYFWPAPGQVNPVNLRAPWTLPTENGYEVIRYFSIVRLNYDADYQKNPIIKVDIELSVNWATVQGDLYYPA